MKPKPDEFDVIVGKNLCTMRKIRNISQTQLAEAMGVSFQQIQKYEKGTNRITAVRLYRAAKYLKTDLLYFFEGNDEFEQADKDVTDFLKIDKQTMEIVRFFGNIKNKELRRNFLRVLKSLSE